MGIGKLESNQYQLETKEEILNYSYELVSNRIKSLGIKQKFPFDKKNIFFLKDPDFSKGNYSTTKDIIEIEIGNWFNIETVTHELVHAISSGKRNNKFHNGSEAFSKSLILNEGTTELIALDILKNDSNKINITKYGKEDIHKLIYDMRIKTAKKIKDIRKKHYSTINDFKQKIKDNNTPELFTLKMITILKENMKMKSKFLLNSCYNTQNYIINKNSNNIIEKSYIEYMELIKYILKNISLFYGKTYDEVFNEWQQDYFNGNYQKIIKQLKKVFGEFDEKIIENTDIINEDIKKIFFKK